MRSNPRRVCARCGVLSQGQSGCVRVENIGRNKAGEASSKDRESDHGREMLPAAIEMEREKKVEGTWPVKKGNVECTREITETLKLLPVYK